MSQFGEIALLAGCHWNNRVRGKQTNTTDIRFLILKKQKCKLMEREGKIKPSSLTTASQRLIRLLVLPGPAAQPGWELGPQAGPNKSDQTFQMFGSSWESSAGVSDHSFGLSALRSLLTQFESDLRVSA